jgi:outer membrane protein
MLRFSLLLLILFPFTNQLFGQDSLSLMSAIELGLLKNYSVQIEKLNYEIDKNNNTWGAAGRYPSVNFNMGQNNARTFRKPTFPNQPSGTTTTNNFTSNLDVAWIIFNGFKVNMNKGRLAELQKLSQGNVSIVIENTIQNIILGYNLAILEKNRLEVLKKTLKLSKERYDLVKLRRQVGTAITFDVLLEENAYLTDSSNFLSQQNNFRNAIRNLNLVMNESLDKNYTLTDSLKAISDNYTLDDLKGKMESSNSNLRNQFINQSLLKYNLNLVQSDRLPIVSVNTGVNTSNDRLYGPQRDNPSVFNDTYGRVQSAYMNFSLRFNIFNGGEIKRNIQNARVQERIGELSTNQLKESLYNDLVQLNDLFALRKNLVSLAQANIKAAELNVSLANERYKNGYLSSIDYRVIQINYQNTALTYLEALYNTIETHTDLLRLTGGIIAEYQK